MVKAFSVAGEKIRQRIRQNTPPELARQIETEADHRALVDVFGENFPRDARGNPMEQGIGSDHWLANVEEDQIERHITAVLKYEGPSAAAAMREKIKRLRSRAGK